MNKMVKTTVFIYCDACGKDVTKEYSANIDVFIRDGHEEIEPAARCYCKECMQSFVAWEKGRKGGINNG